MEAVCSSDTPASTWKYIQRYKPKDQHRRGSTGFAKIQRTLRKSSFVSVQCSCYKSSFASVLVTEQFLCYFQCSCYRTVPLLLSVLLLHNSSFVTFSVLVTEQFLCYFHFSCYKIVPLLVFRAQQFCFRVREAVADARMTDRGGVNIRVFHIHPTILRKPINTHKLAQHNLTRARTFV
jgi:hypothetical protein